MVTEDDRGGGGVLLLLCGSVMPLRPYVPAEIEINLVFIPTKYILQNTKALLFPPLPLAHNSALLLLF